MKRYVTLLGLALMASASAQNTGPQFVNNMVRAGEVITNIGSLEGFQGDGTEAFTASSNTVQATVTQVAGVNVTIGGLDTTTADAPGQTVSVRRQSTGELIYVLTNTGNGEDTFTLSLSSTNPTAPTMWVDMDSNGVMAGLGEARTNGGTVTLPAGMSVNVHVVESIGNVASGTRYVNTLGATSIRPGASDTDNYGALTVQSDLDAALESNTTTNVVPGSVTVLNKTFTNTGNTTLGTLNINFTVSDSGNVGMMTYIYNFGGVVNSPSLQGAWDAYVSATGGLPMNQSVPLTITATAANSGLGNGQTTQRLNRFTLIASNGDNLPAFTDQDEMNFTARVFAATHVKAQSLCSSTPGGYSCAPMEQTDISPKPCDVIVYGLTTRGVNDFAQIRTPIISDSLDGRMQLLFARAYGAANEANFENNPIQMPTRIAGGSWTTGMNTPASTMAGTPILIEAGYDSDGNNVINNSDLMVSKAVLSLGVVAQVRGDSCAPFDPATAQNMPTLPYDDTPMNGGGGVITPPPFTGDL